MRIETRSGHTILADDADYPLLWNYTWYVIKNGGGRLYAQARVPRAGQRILMHRLLMEPPPGRVVHHINDNSLDNRRCNLQATSVSGYVYRQGNGWRAEVRDEMGKRVLLGSFATEERARAVVQNWCYRKMLELEQSFEAQTGK